MAVLRWLLVVLAGLRVAEPKWLFAVSTALFLWAVAQPQAFFAWSV